MIGAVTCGLKSLAASMSGQVCATQAIRRMRMGVDRSVPARAEAAWPPSAYGMARGCERDLVCFAGGLPVAGAGAELPTALDGTALFLCVAR